MIIYSLVPKSYKFFHSSNKHDNICIHVKKVHKLRGHRDDTTGKTFSHKIHFAFYPHFFFHFSSSRRLETSKTIHSRAICQSKSGFDESAKTLSKDRFKRCPSILKSHASTSSVSLMWKDLRVRR